MERALTKQSDLPTPIQYSPGAVISALNNNLPTPQEIAVYEAWAHNAFDSQMYRTIGKESAIMMIMLAAREFGIGPAQALNGGLHIIEGKVVLSARIMSELIRRARHHLKIVVSDDSKCTIIGKRSDTGEEHTVTFTIEEAQAAGLIKDKSAWKKCPTDMLFARTLSRLARQLFSDCIGIGYVEGEIIATRASNEELEASTEVPIDNGIGCSTYDELERELLLQYNPDSHDDLLEFIAVIAKNYNQTKIFVMKMFLKDPFGASKRFEDYQKSKQPKESNE